MKAQTWRRAALASYILAGASLTVAGYTVATTEANANALYRFAEHDNDAYSARSRSIAEGITAAALRGQGDGVPDAADWPRIIPQVIPSAVNVAALPFVTRPDDESRVWLVPGVQSNPATATLGAVRFWLKSRDQEPRHWQTIGSGAFIADGRYVLTAAHVIDGKSGYRVQTAAGRWLDAELIGLDLRRDVGVLRVSEPGQPIKTGAMPIQGQPVLTIGAPGGRGFSVSAGIVSRYAESARFSADEALQIDAPVTGGNSGGLVVSARGEAVGVVSHSDAAFTQAVPIGTALAVATELIERSR